MNAEACRQPSVLRPILFIALLAVFVGLARYFQLERYVEEDRLRQLVAASGAWAPLVYLAIWTIAPPLMIPATALVVIGGILFGPVWGEIYVVLGATAGAVVSFLIARYLARDWVAGKLVGTRLLAVDQLVAQKGWKIVALSRLVPIFPYFLVNYAFGLTKVSLGVFVLATFIGIIPLTMAYVYLSSNFVELLLGKIGVNDILLIIAVAGFIMILPVVIKKKKCKDYFSFLYKN